VASLVFINRFKGKKVAKKLWEHVIEIDTELAKRNCDPIFETIIIDGLDSG